jgi:hypothetical protein
MAKRDLPPHRHLLISQSASSLHTPLHNSKSSISVRLCDVLMRINRIQEKLFFYFWDVQIDGSVGL